MGLVFLFHGAVWIDRRNSDVVDPGSRDARETVEVVAAFVLKRRINKTGAWDKRLYSISSC
jgi:hypothetical protein